MIKNYTSGVPVDRTMAKIESALVRGGAINIMKDYQDGMVNAVCFFVQEPKTGKRLAIRLPVNVEAVHQILQSKIKRPRPGTLNKLKEQAARTAWKLVQDWVEVQLSLIEMQQVEFLQVFLPYVWDGKRTFYNVLKDNGFKMLTDGKGS